MAEINPRSRNGLGDRLLAYVWKHIVAVNFFAMGLFGAISCAIMLPDDEWKITSISYCTALMACAAVCLICKRGNLYYKNIEEDVKGRFQASRRRAQSISQSRQDNEGLPLLAGLRGSLVVNDNPSFRDFNPLEDAFGGIKEPAPATEDPKVGTSIGQPDNQSKVVVADVHQTRRDSEQFSPKSASPEENESSSSNAPQVFTPPTPDSGVVEQSSQSPQTSEEDQLRPLPDPQL